MRIPLLLALLFTLTGSPAQASISETCGGSLWAGYHWCIARNEATLSRDVIYYFHGHGGSEKGWPSEDIAPLQTLLAADPAKSPAVISVSFGKHWFLSEEPGMFSASELDTFLRVIVPEAESSLPAPPSSRALLGKSMGGFNAIQGAAKASTLFRKVAILCPAQPPITPFSSNAELDNFLKNGHRYLRADLVKGWTKKFRAKFSTPASWEKHDPLILAAAIAKNAKPIFLQSDDLDIFGFYPNAVKFHDALKSAGASVEWHVTPNGGHCDRTPETTQALAAFLLN